MQLAPAPRIAPPAEHVLELPMEAGLFSIAVLFDSRRQRVQLYQVVGEWDASAVKIQRVKSLSSWAAAISSVLRHLVVPRCFRFPHTHNPRHHSGRLNSQYSSASSSSFGSLPQSGTLTSFTTGPGPCATQTSPLG